MRIRFFSESTSEGAEVDWPSVPSIGDFVTFRYRGGSETQKVSRVEWHGNSEHFFDGVDVHLTFGPKTSTYNLDNV